MVAMRRLFVWLVLLGLRSSLAQECTQDGACDKHERCAAWKEEGECLRSAAYMKQHCPASCASVDVKPVKCEDAHPNCHVWADLQECEANPGPMSKYCAASCGICEQEDEDDEDDACQDMHDNCPFWASKGECKSNPRYMSKNCPFSCDTCDKVEPVQKSRKTTEELDETMVLDASVALGVRQQAEGYQKYEILEMVQSSLDYAQGDEFLKLPRAVTENCKNKHELCSFWALIGECENNMAYMKVNCAPACQSCHLIDMSTRCPKLDDAEPALRPGDLNKMFERIVETAPGNRTLSVDEKAELEKLNMPHYTVTVHSRPSPGSEDVGIAFDKSMPPWLVTFDNILTDEECRAMIELGHEYVYARSEDVGSLKFDGTHTSVQSERRTSENAWCSTREGCREREVPTLLHERIAKVLQIPADNSEDFQLLKYEHGQFYRQHHDYIPHQRDRQCGPRILTFFLYLSDVEKGGGTDFPLLGITVQPKRGRAVLWPSIYNSQPLDSDGRMDHQALDVEEGTKYAANAWIHMYDYVGPQQRGCN